MMRNKCRLILPVVLGITLICGCASQAPSVVTKNENKTAKVIAVLPVDNKTSDDKAPQLFRSKVLDELYFKGYSNLPTEIIDRKLKLLYGNENKNQRGVIAPNVIKELVGADAVMYCTITEGKRSVSLFYAPVTVAASCELRSTQTGEVLWNGRCKSTSRNFDLPGERVEMKSYEAFESVIDEVVNEVMKTLPDGPKLKG